jgi:SAM-dependent methyltransferase
MKICPNCLGSELKTYEETCGACGWKSRKVEGVLDFLSNKQRQDNVYQNYNKNYEELAQKNIKESNIDRNFLRTQAKNLIKYLGNISGSAVCEIGIGQGFLCDELLQRGVGRIVAVDVAMAYLKKFADTPGVELYLANAETLPFEGEFDLIVSTDVMEHVLNVGSFLFCVNRALVPGGRVAIRVPYREGLLNYSPHCGYGHKFGHLRSFNKDILRIYLEQSGFRVLGFYLDGYSPYIPRDWVMKSRFGRLMIHHLQQHVEGRLSHWSEIVNLPRPIITGLLRPVEIAVIATKIDSLTGNNGRPA